MRSNSLINFTKGVVTGVVVGTTVGMVVKSISQPARSHKRTAGKAMRVLSSVLENITHF